MKPALVPDVFTYAGDTVEFGSYTFKTGTTPIDLVAAGWTNWSAQWRTVSDEPTALTLTVDTTQATTGIISVRAEHGVSRDMGQNGVWDLQADRADGSGRFVQTFVYGKTKWREDVTRIPVDE